MSNINTLFAEEDGESIVYRAPHEHEFIMTADMGLTEYSRLRDAGLIPVELAANGLIREPFNKWYDFRNGEKPNLDPEAVRKARDPLADRFPAGMQTRNPDGTWSGDKASAGPADYDSMSLDDFMQARNAETKARGY